MDESNEARICERCRVVTVRDLRTRSWVHPFDLALKFSDHVCQEPIPGRPARGREARWGRGDSYRSDRYRLLGEIPELALPPDTPLIVAVDGSYKLVASERSVRKPISWSYFTTSGMYGIGTSTIPGSIIGGNRPLQGELRAVWAALLRIPSTHPVELLIDSYKAVALIRDWKLGYYRMPPGYTLERKSGRDATLVQLARLIRERSDMITVTHVQGHTGHPLNEGADALAKIARAWATVRLSPAEAEQSARRIVLGALTQYAATL